MNALKNNYCPACGYDLGFAPWHGISYLMKSVLVVEFSMDTMIVLEEILKNVI